MSQEESNMSKKKFWVIFLLLLVAALLIAACGSAPAAEQPAAAEEAAAEEAPAEEAAAEEAAAEESTAAEEPAAEEAAMPTELKIAAIFISPVEEPWNTSLLQTMERLQAEKPHDLTITFDYTENVAPPDAERVLRQYADSGNYQIIWAHSSYSDQVSVLQEEYPDILWAVSGSGNSPLGGNAYWADVFVHEPAYLTGIIAGMMTESDVIGAVAAFPFPNVNVPLNAYIAGAKSVNPDVTAQVTYIESWFDPPKAKESASAQIAAGADFIYAERFGPFEAAQEKEGVLAFGHFVDQNSIAPDVVVTSALARWDPSARTIIDAWWEHATQDAPYNAPNEAIIFSMQEGGSELASFHDFVDTLPQEVQEAVEQASADIAAGELEVPYNEAPIE